MIGHRSWSDRLNGSLILRSSAFSSCLLATWSVKAKRAREKGGKREKLRDQESNKALVLTSNAPRKKVCQKWTFKQGNES